ncbi:MAG TPA: cupin [bacterium]|nr:cupin [bacterium]HQG47093.1 cupin [bacterium]HQI50031.1 cupin [bacterium]HQJ66400.1 cupin [bacterium]
MARLIPQPSIVPAAGARSKRIEEFIGRVNTGTAALSIARMKSASGWEEPAQQPEFDEYTLVLAGEVVAETREGILKAGPGQAIFAPAGEWVRYSTPGPDGAEYIAVCQPAFSPETVHRVSE